MVPGEELRFVALGDSTTVGVGDPVSGGWRGWSQLLAAELVLSRRLHYENLAVSGAITASVRSSQLAAAVESRPHLASLIVGVNDTMRSTWHPARVRDDALACVEALTSVGAVVLSVRFHDHGAVFGLPGVVRRPLWRRIEIVNAAYEEAHQRFGGLHLGLAVEAAIYERRFWSIDRLHPSELGHRYLAHQFAAGLPGMGYTVDPPDLAVSVADLHHHGRDLVWLTTQGAPCLGRRARDLTPWAARMLTDEARARMAAAARMKARWRLVTSGDRIDGPSDPPANPAMEAASA